MKKEQLTKALEEVLKTITDVKDFTVEQAPDLIQQLITWKITQNVSLLIVSILIGILSIKLWKTIKFDEISDEPLVVLAWLVPCVSALLASCVSITLFFTSLYNLLQLWIAPKIYIIEYIGNLVRRGY